MEKMKSRPDLSRGGLELRALLEASLRGLLQMLQAERGSICWLDVHSQELVVTVAVGSQNGSFLGHRQPIGHGVAGKVALSRQPLLVQQVISDRDLLECQTYRTRSFLCLPLQTSNELFGVVNITDKITGDPFTAADLSRAVEVCSQLAALLQTFGHSDLLRREVELTEKFAAIGRLAAGLVHDLSNPLAGVNSYASILLDRIQEGHLRDYLLMMKSGLNRMATTVRALGQFAQRPIDPRPILEINQVVEDALSTLGLPFSYPQVTVVRQLAGDLPRVSDYGLAQAVSNIVKNACDAMPTGGTLTVSSEAVSSAVILRVSDTGIGISEEHLALIFEPFFTTKAPGQGTGLGLAIAQEIITRYQGTMSVESIVGKGTTFSVHIPVPAAGAGPS